MPLNYQTKLYNDFSGGITDKYIINSGNQYRKAHNLIITEANTLETFHGFSVKYKEESPVRISGLFDLDDDKLLAFRNDSLFKYNDITSLLEIIHTPNGGAFFEYYGNDIYPNYAKWRRQLIMTNSGYSRPMQVFKDDLGNIKTHQAGLPKPTSVGIAPTAGGNNWSYAIHYSHTYKVGNVTYKTVGPVRYHTSIVAATNPVTVTFPTLTAAGNQFNVVDTKVEIYRTTDSEFTFYKVGETVNGAGSYIDNSSDSTIRANATMYTTGDYENHYMPPRCKAFFVVNDIGYYLNCYEDEDGVEVLKPYRMYQSVPGVPTSINPDAYSDVDDDLIGGASFKGIPIIFTESYIYRVEGAVDQFNNGSIRTKVISESIGCVSHRSIITTSQGVFFAGNGGFFVTDGYSYKSITPTLIDSYEKITTTPEHGEKITATYDKVNDIIYWAAGDVETENNLLFIYNVKSGGFTTAGDNNFTCPSVLSFNKSLLRGDDRGYIYDHNSSEKSYLLPDYAVDSDSWTVKEIPFYFEGIADDMGLAAIRKWGADVSITVKTDDNAGIGLKSKNDDGSAEGDMKVIRHFGSFIWRDLNTLWQDNSTIWRRPGTITNTRHFPKKSLRFRQKQVIIEPREVVIYKSDIYGTCTITQPNPLDATRFLVTIESATLVWPTDVVGYNMTFGNDGYTTKTLVQSRTDTVLELLGAGVSIGISQAWQISGLKKSQQFELKSLSLRYAALMELGGRYQKEEAGGNG